MADAEAELAVAGEEVALLTQRLRQLVHESREEYVRLAHAEVSSAAEELQAALREAERLARRLDEARSRVEFFANTTPQAFGRNRASYPTTGLVAGAATRIAQMVERGS